MSIKTILAAASTTLLLVAGAASAGTVSNISAGSVAGSFTADFNVTAVNVTNLNSDQSKATMANYLAALGGTLGGGDETYASDTFAYSGALDFGTSSGSNTTIGSFIASGSGSASGLDPNFAMLTNSKCCIGSGTGTATTTFYLFEAILPFTAGTFDIAHDDGVLVVGVGGREGPTSLKGTRIEGFAGGALSFLYVSTNSDPSIFRVDSDVAPIPLPAAAWMLLAGVAALGVTAQRRKAS